MNELNLEALTIAAALDEERAAGNVRGPLHGIPLSIKDNIGTGDQMHNTGGAAAMQTAKADRDAFVVAKLREAGAVILGKSEWAGWIYPAQPGFSALGGQSVNPLDPRLPVYGSSSGSAVSTSANLVAGSIGTETLGSTSRPSWTRTRFRASAWASTWAWTSPRACPTPCPPTRSRVSSSSSVWTQAPPGWRPPAPRWSSCGGPRPTTTPSSSRWATTASAWPSPTT